MQSLKYQSNFRCFRSKFCESSLPLKCKVLYLKVSKPIINIPFEKVVGSVWIFLMASLIFSMLETSMSLLLTSIGTQLSIIFHKSLPSLLLSEWLFCPYLCTSIQGLTQVGTVHSHTK